MRPLEPDEVTDLARQVRFYGEDHDDDFPAGGSIDDFNWYLMDNLPVADIGPWTRGDWAQWMQNEIDSAAREGCPRRYDLYMTGEQVDWQPVIIVEGIDNNLYALVGAHRIGAAVIRGIPTVDAIVGLRKHKP